MFLSILANLIGLYSLVTLPLTSSFTIDVSDFESLGRVSLIKNDYQLEAPVRKNNHSLGIEITAAVAIVVDKNSGTVLWQKNPQQIRSVASITKLLSVLVFLEHNPGWEETVKIKKSDYRDGGRRYVYTGEEITVRDLFNISLVASDNTAITSLVRSTGIAEEDFVKLMNDKAKSLGMSQGSFTEPTGLDSENKSSASDIIKLIKTAFNHPEIRQTTVQPEYQFTVLNNSKSRSIESTNQLLTSYLDIRAGKTGHLEEAGFCFTGLVKGSVNQEVYVVILGSSNHTGRFQEFKSLAQWAFDNYEWKVVD
ncbi:serine hydrolase [Patescibacteria group bacterium]|nr:serine hydrolase [Patescibacteria group bacterium]